jgi:hypothetical protein
MVNTNPTASSITKAGVAYFCHFGLAGGTGACSCWAAGTGAGVMTGDVKTGFSIADMTPLKEKIQSWLWASGSMRLTSVRAAREQQRQNHQVPWSEKPIFDLISNALSGTREKAQPV